MTKTTAEYDPRLLDWVNNENQDGSWYRHEDGNPLINHMSNLQMQKIFGLPTEGRVKLVKETVKNIKLPDDYPTKSRDFLTQAAVRFFATYPVPEN